MHIMAFVHIAAPLLSNGTEVPSVHTDEYAYAREMANVSFEQVKYNQELTSYNDRKSRQWQQQTFEYTQQLVKLEQRYGLIATDFRKKHNLGERHMDPFSPARSNAPAPGTKDREDWEANMHESLTKMGPPPSRPYLRGTPYPLVLELKDKEKAAFLFRHSALVNAFLAGTKDWHILFFGTEFEAFEDRHLPRLVFLEEVRKTFLVSHKWIGCQRASLPTPEYFVERYTSMYPY